MRRFWYLPLVLLTGVGLLALGVRLTTGLKVTALTTYASWGLWVAFYIYFIGLSAGSFLLSTLVYVFGMKHLERTGRLALLSALLSLGAGLAFVSIDLGHPERFWRTLVQPNFRSVLAWEVFFYGLYAAIILAELVLIAGPVSPRKRAWMKGLGILGLPVAIAVHGGTGSIFAVSVGKPYWNSALVPVLFIVSALASGAALLTFLWALLGPADEEKPGIVRSLAQLMLLFLVIDALLVASEFLVGLYSGVPDEVDAFLSMTARYPFVLWGGQIGLGLVVPILIFLVPATRRSTTWLGLGGLSAVLGVLAVRLNLVMPAYVVPQLDGLGRAYQDARLQYAYTPNLLEWLVAIGVVAAVALAFGLLAQRLLRYHPSEVA